MAILKAEGFDYYMGSKVINQQVMDDVCTVVKEQWGVDCTIQQSLFQLAWNIVISKPHKDLTYCQSGAVSEFNLKSNPFPQYIFTYIQTLVDGLNKQIEIADVKAMPTAADPVPTDNALGWTFEDFYNPKMLILPSVDKTVAITTNTPNQIYATTANISSNYSFNTGKYKMYGSATSGGSTPKKELQPVNSLKEMYELDSSQKPKKVKKVKLTAAQLEKQKEQLKAAAEHGPIQSSNKANYLDQVKEFVFKQSPFIEHLKSKDKSPVEGTKIQENLVGSGAPQTILTNKSTAEMYKSLLEGDKILKLKQLEEIYVDSIELPAQGQQGKISVELKHMKDLINEIEKAQK